MRGGIRLGQPGADAGAALLGQGAADAARHRPGGMDLLAAEGLDDLLAELAEPDAGAGEVARSRRSGRRHCACGWGVSQPSRKSGALRWKKLKAWLWMIWPRFIRRRSFSAAGGMFTAMMASPALAAARRWLTGQMPQMRGGDAGHFAVRPALAELLEAAELDDVELGVGHVASVIHENADFGVALDAGHGVNEDALRHKGTDGRNGTDGQLAELELRALQFRGVCPART